MRFTKMHGLGNDYIYVEGDPPADAAALARRLSDRHLGVGGDGVIWYRRDGDADLAMRVFNADGSEAAMCGNGIRCVGKLAWDRGLVSGTRLRVSTRSGVRELELRLGPDGLVDTVTVAMGRAVVGEAVSVPTEEGPVVCLPVDMGNPHAVCFTEDACSVPLATLGPAVARSPLFPGGVNAEFVHFLHSTALRMRVWERGSGITMACGTGACASAAAAVARRLCPPDADLAVDLDGGRLLVRVGRDGEVSMRGPAETVFEGEVVI